ncbi:ferrous iron transport protein B [Niveibacterium terrae]|uniref:ferrous iron transport protein B n=1 Tax=Niveibacterium terrae TaxID=3373598 RepID=UPI003A92D2A6
MKEAVIHFHPAGRLLALVGNPNCGKTALFNKLTGSRQKVANYAGVTVERKEGRARTPSGASLRVLDLPGAYSLYPRSPDERVTSDVLFGRAAGERKPDLVVCVVDATNLRRTLKLVFAVKRLGLPCLVVLNMTDLADKRGIHVDADALSVELGLPVIRTVAIRNKGVDELLTMLDQESLWQGRPTAGPEQGDHVEVQRILKRLGLDELIPDTPSDRLDRFALHPVFGPLLLAAVLFFVFQAVFAWARPLMDLIQAGAAALGALVGSHLAEGWLRSLLVDGVIAGAGGVLVFLPQILILFLFILLLEESGYLPRAAFLLDRLMGCVGLSGRSFIPLLSCFACAVPGIMATRTIANPRDRLVTILLAPMMTCSARLPVYALLIGAFIPVRKVAGLIELQGLVLFLLYLAGILGAMLIAWILKRFTAEGREVRPLMMELPGYHLPTLANVALGLWQRAKIFVRRVGGVILVSSVLLWFLASHPAPPEGGNQPAIEASYAGKLGHAIAPVFAPIGFNWQLSVALIPAMAAREVVISSLGTVYSLSGADGDEGALGATLAKSWSIASALAMLAWFVFAPHCLSTLAAIRRETGGWKIPLVTTAYLFALAWLAAFLTYRLALLAGLG